MKQLLSIYWENETLFFLDQTKLPEETVREEQASAEQVWDSIKKLKVRGAPAIGIAGAYGLYIAIRSEAHLSQNEFLEKLTTIADYLNSSRPTAVNLSWALKRMVAAAKEGAERGEQPAQLIKILRAEAEAIHNEDKELCRRIGEAGAPLIREGIGILTHCNAGSLATSILGTATAPMYHAHNNGVRFRVYADETRPLLQGARLTSWELQQAGIDVTLICDSAAATLMASGKVNIVLVGADRVASNGDAANKIGTLGVALLAHHYNIPFFVVFPSSTVDRDIQTGKKIPIEERDPEEVRNFGERRTGAKEVKVWNPAFDVTPHELITGLITEKGIFHPPFDKELRRLFQ